MGEETSRKTGLAANPAWPYVAPFATLMILLAVLPGGQPYSYPLRTIAVAAVLLLWSRPAISLRPSRWLGSVLVGAAVFVIWIAPDAIWPGYRDHWLFRNPLTGAAASPVPADARGPLFIAFRFAGSALLVPVVEELFWRAWLMRRLISDPFQRVPLGAYTPLAFWATALLFASEHGAYWDVGLAAGVIYNAWMLRTRNLADCILAHAVTNALLGVYVLACDKWAYWL